MKLPSLCFIALSFILLMGCATTDTTQANSTNDTNKEESSSSSNKSDESSKSSVLTEEELMGEVYTVASDEAPTGYILEGIQPAKITGKEYSDFVVIFKHEKEPLIQFPVVKAFSYQEGEWLSFSILNEEDNAGSSLAIGGIHPFISPDQEEVILNESEGSGGFMSLYIIGSKDGNTIELLHKTEPLPEGAFSYENGELKILDLDSNSETTMKWDNESKTFK
ncbi:hypothetical protein [Metabacillus halosaccharovorans]|uniref:hypothetical protein n=1 Tax=Metabacillus halosaccharovorans TaxID=930124 RepID=UPI0009949EFD|nr:hypothetical protein [Metabacillus halosaccharovorans]